MKSGDAEHGLSSAGTERSNTSGGAPVLSVDVDFTDRR